MRGGKSRFGGKKFQDIGEKREDSESDKSEKWKIHQLQNRTYSMVLNRHGRCVNDFFDYDYE